MPRLDDSLQGDPSERDQRLTWDELIAILDENRTSFDYFVDFATVATWTFNDLSDSDKNILHQLYRGTTRYNLIVPPKYLEVDTPVLTQFAIEEIIFNHGDADFQRNIPLLRRSINRLPSMTRWNLECTAPRDRIKLLLEEEA